MEKYKFFRAQGATEYLVILAAVLVISLVTMSLLGYFTGFSGGITESESQVYWQSVAQPIRILEATTDICACGCAGFPSGYVFVVQNTKTNQIALTGADIEGIASGSICNGRGSSPVSSITLKPGKSVEIGVVPSFATSCSPLVASSSKEAAIAFDYTSNGLALKQQGEKKLRYLCRQQADDGTYSDGTGTTTTEEVGTAVAGGAESARLK